MEKIQALTVKEQPKQKRNLVPAALIGAAMGSGARYIIPTRVEAKNLLNKETFDTFVSSAATKTRGANRSILTFAAIGAALAAGISAIANLTKKSNNESDQYTKLGALMDASPVACEILWYEA